MESDCKPLPHDIIFDILSRLRVRDLCRLRCVSKSWLALISDPVFHRNHRRISEKNPRLLVTTIHYAGSRNRRLVHSILDEGSKTLDPAMQIRLKEEVLGYYYIPTTATTCRDLVCNYDHHNVYVSNPATKKWIHLTGSSLPPQDRQVYTRHVALGYITSTSSYKLFRILSTHIYNDNEKYEFEVRTLGSSPWRAVKGPPGDVLLDFFCRDVGATIDGSVYLLWDDGRLRRNGKITVFDLKEEAWSVVPFPSCHHNDDTYRWSLMEMGGMLCLANWHDTRVGRHWFELWLLKGPHENRPIWEKVRSIDISMVDNRCPYPLAIEQETWKILLRTLSDDRVWFKLQWYDPNDQTMEVIYRARSTFMARLYIESFWSLDVEGSKNMTVQSGERRPIMGKKKSNKKLTTLSNKVMNSLKNTVC